MEHTVQQASVISPFIRNKLRLSITGECNAACFYCHNEGQGHGAPVRMSLDFVKQLANYCRRAGFTVGKVNITGGEPLLHPQLEDMLREMSTVSTSLRLNTNGRLLTKPLVDRLLAVGVDELKIGIDSFLSQNSGDPIKWTAPQRLRDIIAYAAGRCKVAMNTVVTQYNGRQIDDIIAFCESCGVESLKLNQLVDHNFRRQDGYAPGESNAFEAHLDKYRAFAHSVRFDRNIGRMEMTLPSGFTLKWCYSFCAARACGEMYTVIDPEGAIVVCPKAAKHVPVSFSPARKPEAITADILSAQALLCNSGTRRYLRDMRGELISGIAPNPQWQWDQESNPFWQQPEAIAWGMAKRWLPRGGAVLDLGCGLGRHAGVFAEAGFQVMAVDHSEWAIERVRNNFPGITAVCADMTNLPFPDDTFDAVFAFNTLSHADGYLITLAVEELRRVLKPGGEAYLTLCSKNAPAFAQEESPQIDADTRLKLKPGPEYGLAHWYADRNSLRKLLQAFRLLRVWHVENCVIDEVEKNSWHYHVLAQKRENESGYLQPVQGSCKYPAFAATRPL